VGTGTLELVVETDDELYNLIIFFFASIHCAEALRLLTSRTVCSQTTLKLLIGLIYAFTHKTFLSPFEVKGQLIMQIQ
jgi:hypothetical protein